MASLKLKCSAFKDSSNIPEVYTGEGYDRSPPLSWSNVPEGTREFIVICEDLDATHDGKPWVHWLVYNISPSTTMLPEGLDSRDRIEVPVRADQGKNSFGHVGYGGPLPPKGDGPHRYFFRLFALNTELAVKPGATREAVEKAMKGHIIGEASFMGHYERKAQDRGSQPEAGVGAA